MNGVGGTSRLVQGLCRGKRARFRSVAGKRVGSARLITTLVYGGSSFIRKVHCIRSMIRNSVALLLLARGKVCTTESLLKHAPIIVKGGRGTCYISFRDFTCVGLKCASCGRLKPKRVICIAPRSIRAMDPTYRGVEVYSFL